MLSQRRNNFPQYSFSNGPKRHGFNILVSSEVKLKNATVANKIIKYYFLTVWRHAVEFSEKETPRTRKFVEPSSSVSFISSVRNWIRSYVYVINALSSSATYESYEFKWWQRTKYILRLLGYYHVSVRIVDGIERWLPFTTCGFVRSSFFNDNLMFFSFFDLSLVSSFKCIHFFHIIGDLSERCWVHRTNIIHSNIYISSVCLQNVLCLAVVVFVFYLELIIIMNIEKYICMNVEQAVWSIAIRSNIRTAHTHTRMGIFVVQNKLMAADNGKQVYFTFDSIVSRRARDTSTPNVVV